MHGPGPFDEQRHRIVDGERWDGVQPLPGNGQGLPAGGQHVHVGSGPHEELGQLRCGVGDVLAVVEHDQKATIGDVLDEAIGDR